MKTAVIFASLIASTAGFAAKKAAPKKKAVVSSFEGELGVQQPVRVTPCCPIGMRRLS
jgi:hypothetical protein